MRALFFMSIEIADILKHFPKDEPYPNQEEALYRIVRAFDVGLATTVILEAPVGFGKSAVAICLARYYGGAHILTPRKALQDQYFEDFTKDVTVLKGMSNYPCYPAADDRKSRAVIPTTTLNYTQAIASITKGRTPTFQGVNCASGPCRKNKETLRNCLEKRPCTYQVALDMACKAKVTVSNLHSFIANSLMVERLETKPLLIVDEAHDMKDILRDFISSAFVVPYPCVSNRLDIPEFIEMSDWLEWFRQELFTKGMDADSEESYLEEIDAFNKYDMKNFIVSYAEDQFSGFTKFTFQPRNLGNAAEMFLLKYGKRKLLMSGTIYDKKHFCKVNGLNEEETVFIRMPSSFPAKSCPIIVKKAALSNNSFRNFEENFDHTLQAIKRAMAIYHNVRGLIHAPSYDVAHRIQRALESDRILSHTPETFKSVLEYFQDSSEGNAILISPTCYQGIDLKYDRARFQIIIRVPYPNAGDAFMKDLFENNPPAYTYEALVTFGQMLGRPMRAPDDWGHTILLDSRFPDFIKQNAKLLGDDIMKRVVIS